MLVEGEINTRWGVSCSNVRGDDEYASPGDLVNGICYD